MTDACSVQKIMDYPAISEFLLNALVVLNWKEDNFGFIILAYLELFDDFWESFTLLPFLSNT